MRKQQLEKTQLLFAPETQEKFMNGLIAIIETLSVCCGTRSCRVCAHNTHKHLMTSLLCVYYRQSRNGVRQRDIGGGRGVRHLASVSRGSAEHVLVQSARPAAFTRP